MRHCPKKNILLQESGFTLAEMIVSLGVYAIIITSLMSMFLAHTRYIDQCVGKWDVSNQVRKSMNSMIKEMRMSTSLNVAVYDRPADQSGCVLNSNDGKSVVFQVPVDYDSDGDFTDTFGRIDWGANDQLGWSIEYCWDNTTDQILRRVWNDMSVLQENVIMASDISGFSIRGYNYSTVMNQYVISTYLEMVELDIKAEKTEIRGKCLPTPMELTLNNRVVWRN